LTRHRFFTIPLLVAVFAGCSSEVEVSESPARRPAPPRVPPPPPEALVRVIDGDTGRPVHAVVRMAGVAARADESGVSRISTFESGRVTARISARGYLARRLSLPIRTERPVTVRLWRESLQWPLYGANAARTQSHPAIKLRPPFRVVWRRDMKSLLEFPAVVWEGVAYILDFRARLTAVSMRNGRVLWRHRIGRVAASSPAVDAARRQLVVTIKEPGRVRVVSMRNGKVRWSRATARAEASPVIRRGVAYFGDEGGRMYALDLRRRKMRWTFSGAGKITSSATLARGRVYFGDYAGRVFALSARSGRRLWVGSAGTRVYGTVAAARGRVFAPSVFSGLSALSARSGRLAWRIPVGAYLYSSPAYHRGRVYFGTYAGVVYSADADSGRIVWRRGTGGSVSGAIVVVNGVVYAGSFNDRITAWNWRTGRQLWTFPHGRYVPVSGNGGRLVMHGPHGLYAVAPKRRP
jgi:outer membrane protein assembly factor BamB